MTKPEKGKPKDLKKKLKECEKLKNEYLAGWQRARADFLNYKKEETERIEKFLKYGKEEFILRLLSILDSFEKAHREVRSMKYEGTKNKEVIQGFLKIEEQFKDFLKKEGLEEIDTRGKKFDPNFHEAIEQVESPKESGIVVEVIEKGYTLHGKVIRPAKVKVAK